jgi:hypothetical protein
MLEPTRSEQRRHPIQKLQTQADRLMDLAQHDSVKAVIRRACQALDEARDHLCEPNIDDRPSMLGLIDMCLDYAASHLQRVEKALCLHGPNAVLAH